MTHSPAQRKNSYFSLCPTTLKLSHLPSIKMKAAAGARTAMRLPARPKDVPLLFLGQSLGALTPHSAPQHGRHESRPVRLLWPHARRLEKGAQGFSGRQGPWAKARAGGLRQTAPPWASSGQVALGKPRPLGLLRLQNKAADLEDRDPQSRQALSAPPRSSPMGPRGKQPGGLIPGRLIRWWPSPSTPRVPTGRGLKEAGGKKSSAQPRPVCTGT